MSSTSPEPSTMRPRLAPTTAATGHLATLLAGEHDVQAKDYLKWIMELVTQVEKLEARKKAPEGQRSAQQAENTFTETLNAMSWASSYVIKLAETALADFALTPKDQARVEELFELAKNVSSVYVKQYKMRLRPFTSSVLGDFLSKMHSALDVFDRVIVEGKREDKTTLVPGTKNMYIYNTAKVPTASLDSVRSACAKAAALIAKHGGSEILYGRILLLTEQNLELNNQTMRKSVKLMTHGAKSTKSHGSVLAYYRQDDDLIVIQITKTTVVSDDDLDSAFLYTLIHELGHRIEFKFPGSLDMAEMKKLYLAGIKAVKGKKGFNVKRADIVELQLGQFTTPYSTTNATEMFAEAFAALVMPKAAAKQIKSAEHVELANATLKTYYKKAK